MRERHGFTLIELLVASAIIAILAAILFPVSAGAREKARAQGKSVQEVENAAMAAVQNLLSAREAQQTAPTAPFKAGAQRESPDVQNITAGDVKEQDLAEEKTVMPIPDDPVGSALKAIQTIIDNISQKMDKYLNAIQSYVDTVSSTMSGSTSSPTFPSRPISIPTRLISSCATMFRDRERAGKEKV